MQRLTIRSIAAGTSGRSRRTGLGRSSMCCRTTRQGRVRLEGHLARQHLVQHASQRVDIGAHVGGPSSRLLGRHVVRRAHYGAGGRHGGKQFGAGDAEVGQFCPAVRTDEHVLRLHVAVNDAQGVRRRQSRGDLDPEGGGALHRQGARALDDAAQALGKELQGHEVPAIVLADLEYLDDVRVVDG